MRERECVCGVCMRERESVCVCDICVCVYVRCVVERERES